MTSTYKKRSEIEAVQLTEENFDQVFEWVKSMEPTSSIGKDYWDGSKTIRITEEEWDNPACKIGGFIAISPYPNSKQKLYACDEHQFLKVWSKKEN